jgi:acyl-CoA oxidase
MIGAGLMGSHSGVTAEGDNSVLMQKVTKDLLAHSRNGKHKTPKILKQTLIEIAQKDDISSFNCLKTLIYIRE